MKNLFTDILSGYMRLKVCIEDNRSDLVYLKLLKQSLKSKISHFILNTMIYINFQKKLIIA